jgi:DNA-binding response OmpR family regulator
MTDFDQSETGPGGTASRRVLLLVHPDALVAAAIEQTLGADWRVVAVDDGADALRVLATIPVDMLAIDQSIVRADGGDFLLEKARRTRLAAVPTVVMAARPRTEPLPETDVDADHSGPFAIEQLCARIRCCDD